MSASRQTGHRAGELHAIPGESGDLETRSRILDAAIECFAHFGNDKTTVNDVARAAGVSRQTVYRYFSDRTALLEAVDLFEHQQTTAEVARIAETAPDLETFIARLATRQAANANRYRTREHLIRHDRGLFQSLFLSQERSIERVAEVVRPQIVAAADRGELREAIDLDQATEWVAITLTAMTRLSSARSFDLDDPDAVGKFVAAHVCRGLVAR
jgi:AcrR family transcriptional regulator